MKKKELKDVINGLLDVYLDYKSLHEMFGDAYYKEIMELSLQQLGKIVEVHKEQLA